MAYESPTVDKGTCSADYPHRTKVELLNEPLDLGNAACLSLAPIDITDNTYISAARCRRLLHPMDITRQRAESLLRQVTDACARETQHKGTQIGGIHLKGTQVLTSNLGHTRSRSDYDLHYIANNLPCFSSQISAINKILMTNSL